MTLVGIDPERERSVSFVADDMSEGRFLESSDDRGLVVGRKLLDKGEAATLQQIARAAKEHAEGRQSGAIKPGLGSYVFQVLTGFPIEAWNPVEKKPVVVYTLLVMLGLLFEQTLDISDCGLDRFRVPARTHFPDVSGPAFIEMPLAGFMFTDGCADIADQDIRRADIELGHGGPESERDQQSYDNAESPRAP